MDNISKSVFFVAVDDVCEDITAGIFIVTVADVDEDDDDVDDDDVDDVDVVDVDVNADDRLLGNTNVTDVTISSSSVVVVFTPPIVAVSFPVTLDVIVVDGAFPFYTYDVIICY